MGERVGGVEPETVTRLWEHKQSGLLTRHDPQWRNGADQWSEPCEFVPLSALRLVEEELARVRVLVHDHIDANGRLRKEGNALREERDGARLAGQEAVAALVERTAQRNNAEADRDRLANTLLIAHEFIESVGSWVGCHPDERAEVLAEVDAALAALPPVQGEHEQGFDLTGPWDVPGEHEQGDRCIVCGGKGRRSSWVNELGREVEADCPDCDGTGTAQDGDTEETT